MFFSVFLASQPLISTSMRRLLTKFSPPSSSSSSLHKLCMGRFRGLHTTHSKGYNKQSFLQEISASRHVYKCQHVCAATAIEPPLTEEMVNLASEIKSLGETIREMKNQMKNPNGSDVNVDKKVLEANIATLLEMKGRFADMQAAVQENFDETINDEEVVKKSISGESKRIDTSKLSIRPSLDDVERISKGQAAKRRGTGSRAVPHRLNEMERKEW